jgi:RNA polymerase sigma-70 factor (ECF subfamily)
MVVRMQEAAPSPRPLPSLADDEAVHRCQTGDRNAFRHIVETYGGVMFGTALMMTGDRALAEDLTQDALVQAWRGMRTFRRGSPLRPWLIRILVNRTVSQRRRRVLGMVPMLWAERNRSDAPGPDAVVELEESHAEVRAALRQLPPEQRELLALRYYTGLSVPEISTTTGVAEGTVKSRLSRAHARLRALLQTQAE